jgi:hypothetical protein
MNPIQAVRDLTDLSREIAGALRLLAVGAASSTLSDYSSTGDGSATDRSSEPSREQTATP